MVHPMAQATDHAITMVLTAFRKPNMLKLLRKKGISLIRKQKRQTSSSAN